MEGVRNVECVFLHRPKHFEIPEETVVQLPLKKTVRQVLATVPGPYAYPSLQEDYEGPAAWEGDWQDALLELKKEAEEIPFDVIYCHDWPLLPLALELKQQTKKPLVLHIHSLEYDRSRVPSDWLMRLERKGMDVADRVIVGSNYHVEVIRKNYFAYPGKITVIHPGADHISGTEYEQTPEPLLVFMGRLSEQKGILDFMRICELLFINVNHLQVAIAGEGELEEQVKQHIQTSVYKERFTLLGFLNEEEKVALLQSATLFCAPSISEPFGLSIVEAARLGVPSVVSDRCGAREVLPSLLHAPPGDQAGFVFPLLSILNNPSIRKSMADQAKNEASKLTWAETVRQIEKVLTSQVVG